MSDTDKPRTIRITYPADFKFVDGVKLRMDQDDYSTRVIATMRIIEIPADEVQS